MGKKRKLKKALEAGAQSFMTTAGGLAGSTSQGSTRNPIKRGLKDIKSRPGFGTAAERVKNP